MAVHKIDIETMEVTEVKSSVITRRFTLDELKEQKKSIKEQRDRELADRTRELAEVDLLIAEARKQGLRETL